MLHFTMDAFGIEEEHTNDLMCINELLVKVLFDLGMRAIMPPFLLPYYYCEDASDGGISAFCFTEGGHITIHTFPYRGCYFADVFGRNFFSQQSAEKAFTKRLYARKITTNMLDRRFPDSFPTCVEGDSADFGPHYVITVKDVEMGFEQIFRILDTIPSKINMLPITRPMVMFDNTENPNFISGIVLVAQSHICIHYDIANKQVYMDIFSCKFLDDSTIHNVIDELYGNKADYRLMIRGEKYVWNSTTSRERYDRYSSWRGDKKNR